MTHEALETGGTLLRFAPVPGLDEVARVLLSIWDALQQVDVSRLVTSQWVRNSIHWLDEQKRVPAFDRTLCGNPTCSSNGDLRCRRLCW